MTTKTQTENAIKWIEALLSGKYKQGKDHLGNEEIGFCCWGLGCFITGKKYKHSNGWNSYFYKHIGFNDKNGEIIPSLYGYNNLAMVNDHTPAGFKRIGKYLIKHAKTNFNEIVAEGITKHFNGN